jgi:hypothetical protein
MKKETYFALVDLKKEFMEALEEENNHWNRYTCWYGTPEEQQEHMDKVKSFVEHIEGADQELSNARQSLSKETLKEWSKEYYSK